MDQTQIKLKASVFNKTTGPLDISITGTSAMRLLVAQRDLPESWRPPEKTVAAGDTPVLVEWSGSGSKQNYWALPPNVFADSYATPAGAATGFYTQWDPPILESGEGYYGPRAEPFDPFNADGNLVFQLPVGSVVTGLAVVDKTDPTKIIAVTPFSEWKDREVPPYTFLAFDVPESPTRTPSGWRNGPEGTARGSHRRHSGFQFHCGDADGPS